MKQVNVRLSQMLGKITICYHCLIFHSLTIHKENTSLDGRKSRNKIVGGSWEGIDYRRSKSNRRNFEPTEKQRIQNLQFVLTIRFLQPIAGLPVLVSAALTL
jgi:hypothetical protein